MSSKEAQTSIEFLVAFSIILLVFALFSVVLYQKFVQVNELKANLAGKSISLSLAQSINDVSLAGEGFSQVIELPEKIAQSAYTLNFYSGEPTVFVSTEQQTWVAPVFTPEINCTLDECSLMEGIITLKVNSTRKVKVVNKEGKIYLEEP